MRGKSGQPAAPQTIFKLFSGGVKTNRDEVVYDFQKEVLIERVKQFIEDYNSEADRHKRSTEKGSVDDFVRYDRIKWSESLKVHLDRGDYAAFDDQRIRAALYRPFCKRWLFFDRTLNERVFITRFIVRSLPRTSDASCRESR